MSEPADAALRRDLADLREQVRERGLLLDVLLRHARGEYPKRRSKNEHRFRERVRMMTDAEIEAIRRG